MRKAEHGSSMSSRERVGEVLRGRLPDRVPFNFWMDRWRMGELDLEIGGGEDFRLSCYGADVIEVIIPLSWFSEVPRIRRVDEKGEEWISESAVSSIQELINVPFPEADDSLYVEELRKARHCWPDKALFPLFLNQLDVLMTVRKMEDFFLDLYDYPEVVETLCMGIADRTADIIAYVIENSDVDCIYLAGDIAGNRGPLISLDQLERFWLPGVRKCVDTAHRLGKPVLYHTDGKMDEIFPLLHRSGVDGLNPLQANVNRPERFLPWKERFVVYGGLDNNVIIPEGPPIRIREHVKDLFYRLSGSRGLIMSSHDIPGETPMEHIEVLVDEMKRCIYKGGTR